MRRLILLSAVLTLSATAASASIPWDDAMDPAAPCVLTVTEAGSNRTCAWSSVSGADHYKVGRYKNTTEGVVDHLATVSNLSYVDSTWNSSWCYDYVVVAYDSAGDKICSALVTEVGSCP